MINNRLKSDYSSSLSPCRLCPRECGIDRFSAAGLCGGTDEMRVNLHQLHFWEEPVLSGTRGSGAVFFSNCALRCVYCQNHRISHGGHGAVRTPDELVGMMLELQEGGAHNVNLVTGSHYTPLISESLRRARRRGLRVPVVWNSSAYEKPETLRLLEDLVDVYLPDFRYHDPAAAARYSAAPDYPEWARKAIREMFRQTGHLLVEHGIAVRGIIIRLLLLPGLTRPTRAILSWIRSEFGAGTWVSLMGQYYPAYQSAGFPEINRSLAAAEYEECLEYLEDLGFENGFTQEVGSDAGYTPEFDRGEGTL